jgi:hypothetical protein
MTWEIAELRPPPLATSTVLPCFESYGLECRPWSHARKGALPHMIGFKESVY